ncbi:class I SAM-dependent methyltransferase [Streptomyces flavofungini]|uniref:Class I SAM-dependent methyltransferase n=1 Tax=Streptomyces flavofungini TaxID=68200 RepID=A0ABS0X560_9ACTN|nr:class I SAM-dependent methyltransferase [Streptomyces flavofungini]MBJ3808334.1 class I SAM-dependent methyltransferase [Streptomyces flavofungini]GHC57958.1 methyltransferase [Streptomyces flavofungini]
MLDYGKEAVRYDASRGGEPRAVAAAAAVLSLLPAGARTLLDVACGTGSVTRRLAARPGLRVVGVDAAYGMARMAADRVPGAIVLGDSRSLPFRDGAFDAASAVWLLHLLSDPDEAAAVVGECARVLRPGGVLVVTVDKAASHNVGSDIDAVLAGRPVRSPVDAAARVEGYAGAYGLTRVGRARFPGHGQGRSPRSTVEDLRRGWFTSIPPDSPLAGRFARRLAELPDQEVRRPDPEFTLLAFHKPPA